MSEDFADFLAALNSEGVAYVVIGGFAVLSYVPYRTTRDLGVLIEPTLDNASRALRAAGAWGGFEPTFTAADAISGDILSFGGLLRVEIHSRVPGVTWEDVWSHRVPGELRGVPTSFAGIDELIAMEAATAHPDKDLPDVERLRLLREASERPRPSNRERE
jgi:hypothetical protein